MKNLLKSASMAGIAFGLGLVATSALAQQVARDSGHTSQTSGSYDGNSFTRNTTADNGNNQSHNLSADNGNNQSKNTSQDNGNNESKNTSEDNGNNQSKNDDMGNDQSTHLAYSRDNGNNQSTNNSDDTSLKVGNVTVALSTADLSGSVSGQSFNAGRGGGNVDSGALTLQGNSMQGFAGINNGAYITGQGSLGQAMNSVTATSSVTFQ